MVFNESTPVTYTWYPIPYMECLLRADMDIPPVLLKTVIFLEIQEDDVYKQIGTAFFVEETIGNKRFVYLVTCRHVIRPYRKSTQIFARTNAVDESGVVHVPLPNGWIFHEEVGIDLVDLAVLPISPISIPKKVKFSALPSSLLYGQEGMRQFFDRDSQVGDDVMFIGAFRFYLGHSRNYPIVRFGRLALKTQEGLPGVEPWLGVSSYYLVECQAYPGVSGSPVFIMKEYEKKEKYFLVGIMAGYYYEDEKVADKFSHYGISQVVPVEKLGEIIWGDTLEADRKAKMRDMIMRNKPEPASIPSDKEGVSKEEFEDALKKASRPAEERSDEEKSET